MGVRKKLEGTWGLEMINIHCIYVWNSKIMNKIKTPGLILTFAKFKKF